jgi:hypothetical protein
MFGVDRSPDVGVDSPAARVALVNRRPQRQGSGLAHRLSRQVRIEDGEAAVPAGRRERGMVAVAEGVGVEPWRQPLIRY